MKDNEIIEGCHFDEYTLIPNMVMRDSEISIQAKAIYAYLLGYKGNNKYAYPSVSRITSQLNISQPCLNKYLKELVNKDLIIICKGKIEGNQYKNNRYFFKNPEDKFKHGNPPSRFNYNFKKEELSPEKQKEIDDFFESWYVKDLYD